MIVFTAHFKDAEQKVGFSVAFVLNGLQERFVLCEKSTCMVIGFGGNTAGRVSCAVLFERCGWAGTGRLSKAALCDHTVLHLHGPD